MEQVVGSFRKRTKTRIGSKKTLIILSFMFINGTKSKDLYCLCDFILLKGISENGFKHQADALLTLVFPMAQFSSFAFSSMAVHVCRVPAGSS